MLNSHCFKKYQLPLLIISSLSLAKWYNFSGFDVYVLSQIQPQQDPSYGRGDEPTIRSNNNNNNNVLIIQKNNHYHYHQNYENNQNNHSSSTTSNTKSSYYFRGSQNNNNDNDKNDIVLDSSSSASSSSESSSSSSLSSSCWSLWLNGEHPMDHGITWETAGYFDKTPFYEHETSPKFQNHSIYFHYVQDEQENLGLCTEQLRWSIKSDDTIVNKDLYHQCLPKSFCKETALPLSSRHSRRQRRRLKEDASSTFASSSSNTTTTSKSSTTFNTDFDPYEFVKVWKGRTLILSGDSLTKMFYEDLVESLVLAKLDATNQIQTSFEHLDVLHWNRPLFQCRVFVHDVIICTMWGPGSDGFRDGSYNIDSLTPFPNKTVTKHTAILKDILQPHDVIVWNAGVHEGTDDESLTRLKQSVQQVIESYKAMNHDKNQAQLWWKETLPQHFELGYYSGKYDSDSCFPTPAHYNGSSTTGSLGPYNDVTTPIVQAAGDIPIMPTYRSAVPLHKAHYDPKQDCTHFCHGKYGPHELQKSILTQMAKDAIAAGALPPVVTKNNNDDDKANTSLSLLQQRWNALMEHPTESALSRIEVCGTDKFSWWSEFYGPVPPSLKTCLCHSYQTRHLRDSPGLLYETVQHLQLDTTC